MEKTGDKLYNLRIEHNISQEQLAASIGVTRQTISLWEANRRQISTDKLKLICEMFDVSSEYFLLGDDKMTSKALSNDEDIVCAEVNQESQNDIIDTQTSPQKEKKKLSKKSKIAIVAIVLSIFIVIGIVLIVFSTIVASPKLEGSYEITEETSVTWNFSIENIGWILFSASIATAIVLGSIFISMLVKKRKINKETNDIDQKNMK